MFEVHMQGIVFLVVVFLMVIVFLVVREIFFVIIVCILGINGLEMK